MDDLKLLLLAIKHNYYIKLTIGQDQIKYWDNKLYINDQEIILAKL